MVSILPQYNITKDIIDLVEDLDISFMEAIIRYCDTRQIDIEYIGKLIKGNEFLRSSVQTEAEDLHFLKKSASLPI